MKKHSDYVTHINNNEDIIYLRNKHFPVNIRLFNTSPEYKEIILLQCNYIRKMCLTKMEGYKRPHGMSSANLGLSFNIVGIVFNRNTINEYCKIMINPVIRSFHGNIVSAISNCGSITLNKPIEVDRHEDVIVEYHDENGNPKIEKFYRKDRSFTIQHEVDHNNGILITDL